jgi:hypothetical protein
LSSAKPIESISSADEMRYPILPFVAIWRRTRFVLYYSVLVVVVAIAIDYFGHHEIQIPFVILGAAVLALALLLQLGSGRHYLAVESDGLRISGLLRSEVIPFHVIRQLRVQRVEILFEAPSRRNRLDRSLRAFRQTRACLARLDLDREEVYRLGRLLGRGTWVDQDLIFIVARADELEKSLLPRIAGRSPNRARSGPSARNAAGDRR